MSTRSNLKAMRSAVLLDRLVSCGSVLQKEVEELHCESTTPTNFISNRWSDTTLTGSVTGRSSYCSWNEDQAEHDRIAEESVQRLFDNIEDALYEGKSTKLPEVDKECANWSGNFVYLRVEGKHLLDTGVEGVEMIDPVIIEDANTPTDDETDPGSLPSLPSGPLEVKGCAVELKERPLPDDNDLSYQKPGEYLEVTICEHGAMEEFFAVDTSDEDDIRLKKKLRHKPGLPPVTPSECVRDTVCCSVFDQVWSEVVTVLQPLLMKQNTLSNQRSPFRDGSLPVLCTPLPHTNQVSIHEFSLPLGNAPQRGPTHITLQPLKTRLAAPGPLAPGIPTHHADLPSLKEVMTIRPVPLQHRITSSTLPLLGQSNYPVNSDGNDGSSLMMYMYNSTRLPPRHIQTPRRNLKPLEMPKLSYPYDHTSDERIPGLVGQRLLRHQQLPPLKKHVTFGNNRIVSAAVENDELTGMYSSRRTVSGVHVDHRPNTTNTFSRSETPLGHGSTHNLLFGSRPIKVIGHAASLHNEKVLREELEDVDSSQYHNHQSSQSISRPARGRIHRSYGRQPPFI